MAVEDNRIDPQARSGPIAKLYGLSRDHLRYILDSEDAMGKGYPSETFHVLKKNELAK